MKPIKVMSTVSLMSMLFLAACGKGEEQKEYDGLSDKDTKIVNTKPATTEEATTENSDKVEDKSLEKNQNENEDTSIKDTLDKTDEDKKVKKNNNVKIATNTSDNDDYVEKLKNLPQEKIDKYEALALRPREDDNLGKRDALMQVYLPEGSKPASTEMTDKIEKTFINSYKDAVKAGVQNGMSSDVSALADKYFNGEPMVEPYRKFLRANMSADKSSMKVVKGSGGPTNYRWSADLKTPDGKVGGTIFGNYDSENGMMNILDSAISEEGKPYFDADAKRIYVIYDQIQEG